MARLLLGYEELCAACGRQEIFVVVVATLLHAVALWGSASVFVLAERLKLFERYRLPRDAAHLRAEHPSNLALNKSARQDVVIGTLVIVPVVVAGVSPLIRYSGMSVCGPLPPARKWLLDIALQIVGCDALFYWIHRTLHHPLLYRTLHKKHHEFRATTIWASEHFGEVDFVLNVLPGVIPALLLGAHFAVLMAFTVIRQWQTVQSHSGYDLPFDPFNRGVFHGGARRHDFHHTHNHGCYSDFLPFWDWLCGTDRKYAEYWQKNCHRAAY